MMKTGIVCVTVTLIFSVIAIVLLEFSTQQLSPFPITTPIPPMDSEVIHEFYFFNVLKDGSVNVFSPPTQLVPPSDHPTTGVKVKDVHISPNLSARLFLPHSASKLPVMLYIHGGGFCTQSAFNPVYTAFVADLAAKANIIAVSVEYGLFPARPIPACYQDSWEALRWIASHAAGSGLEPWLNDHGDLKRLFMAGDSAGANICHTLAARVGSEGLPGGVFIEGIIMIHPYFGEDDKMWMYMCPTNEGPRDRRMKAAVEDMKSLGARRVLVLVAENDPLRSAGLGYAKELNSSGFEGRVELVENKGREHCFHLSNHLDVQALSNMVTMVSFIKNHTHP